MQQKVRVLLSTQLLEAIASNTDLVTAHPEINKVIIPALHRVNTGITTTYSVKSLTLEQKVAKGLATPEELSEYETNLLNSL